MHRTVAAAAAAFAALSGVAHAGLSTSLAQACTAAQVVNSLPDISGLVLDSSSVTANAVLGWAVSGSNDQPNSVFDFCNVTFTYGHVDKDDTITLTYWLPAPQDFQKRYLSTGGGGEAINSGTRGLQMGVPYGAVTGITDGGLGPTDNFYAVTLYANNSINYEEWYMFAYAAHHELAVVGKAFTSLFFNMGSTKLYSYYQACSEGGREGMSQVQRFGGQFDGAIIGAPAFRYAFQQVQHLFGGLAQHLMNYYAAPCMLEYAVNQTIIACDPLDGLTDGVVSRTDLCILNYDISVIKGQRYSCAASRGLPAVNATVTKQDITLLKTLLNGLHDSSGKRVYFTYQPSAALSDATGNNYNATSGLYYNTPSGIGGEWVAQVLQEQKINNLASWGNTSYDTLKEWINLGLRKTYSDLHTAWPDLTPFQTGGGKILHYHGESDYSIPTASSVRFFESVRQIMYPGLSMQAGAAALSEWYRLYLVPGGSHCSPNSAEPNGPWPQTNLAVIIDWVENEVVPTTLNATHLAGSNVGANAQICTWPERPLWTNGAMSCVFDQKSYNTWIYNLNAILMPVY